MSRFDVTALPMNMREKIMVDSGRPETNGSECWVWLGAQNSKGYGSVTNGRGGSMLTHRKAYELIVGPIPRGLTIDHLCLNKTCVNTDHMEVVTRAENSRRKNAQQTHCKHGHPLSGDNLYLAKRRTGMTLRVCRTCHRRWQRERYARQKATVNVPVSRFFPEGAAA